MIGIGRVVRRTERGQRCPWTATFTQTLRGLVLAAEEAVGAHGEHVLHRHNDAALRFEFDNLFREAFGVLALPPERRVDDHRRRSQGFGGAHRTLELLDRIGTPHALRNQQTRRMHRLHRNRILANEGSDSTDVLTHGFGPHHQFDAVVSEISGVAKCRFRVLRIHRSRRQADGYRPTNHALRSPDHRPINPRSTRTPVDRASRSCRRPPRSRNS